jgi:hypothetical protein
MVNAAKWDNVLVSNDVNIAYDSFWSTYNELFLLNFPLKKMRFNKNIHGLMESLTDASAPALERYKKYKNLYFKTLRAMKKFHYSRIFEDAKC